MLTWNKSAHHGHILLSPDRRRGVIAIESIRRNGKTLRTALQVPTSASAHGLIVIGLTAALLRWPQVKYIDHITEKFSILVTVNDETFVSAITAQINRDARQIALTPLRAGKHLLRPLAKQLSRFHVRWAGADDSNAHEAFNTLHKWSKSHIKDPKDFRVPSLYEPVAATELVWF